MNVSIHAAIRFVLELASLIAAGILGASIGSPPFGLVGAVVAVVAFAVVWGLFLAPRARFPQTAAFRLFVGTIGLEVPPVGLILTNPSLTGPALAIAILINAAALYLTGEANADSTPAG